MPSPTEAVSVSRRSAKSMIDFPTSVFHYQILQTQLRIHGLSPLLTSPSTVRDNYTYLRRGVRFVALSSDPRHDLSEPHQIQYGFIRTGTKATSFRAWSFQIQQGISTVLLYLENSVTLVVGGASGIGKASVRAFLDEGTRVVIWDIEEVDTPVCDRDQCVAMQLDISDQAAVEKAIIETESLVGSIDHLVHAAAIGSGKYGFPFTNLEPQDWNRILEVNVTGMVNVAHSLSPHMVRHGRGTMVFVASVAGQIGSPTDPPYSASKAANINFAQVMARDLASSGIRVNTVCPGMVKTPLNRLVWKSWNERQPPDGKLSYEEWGERKIQQMIPLGTWQQPEDIADMILFLSSTRTAQVTGQTINVDGGFVMHW